MALQSVRHSSVLFLVLCLVLSVCAKSEEKNPSEPGAARLKDSPVLKAPLSVQPLQASSNPSTEAAKLDINAVFIRYGQLEAKTLWNASHESNSTMAGTAMFDGYTQFRELAASPVSELKDEFFKGRYNRSRARLPENIDKWRSEPDIANPGPDLANFPNSAFTLPQGRAYMELSPFTFYGSATGQSVQYNFEYLLRYGVTDDIELRLFGNGVSWNGGEKPAWGFAPLAFDTKIQMWTEKPEYFIPAAGFEAYLQTEWLGNAPFNGGTQPSFMFNFDQSLPYDIDF